VHQSVLEVKVIVMHGENMGKFFSPSLSKDTLNPCNLVLIVERNIHNINLYGFPLTLQGTDKAPRRTQSCEIRPAIMKGIEPSRFFTQTETENKSPYFIILPSVEANFT
jgi:hypothetical protein